MFSAIKRFSALFAFVLVTIQSSYAVLPIPNSHSARFRGFNYNQIFSTLSNGNIYQIGSEWGKKPVTLQDLDHSTPAFRRAALATARLGGGTGFYLGKFNGHHVMATNHHVCPNGAACLGIFAQFPFFTKQFKLVKFFGTWSAIDLTLLEIEVPTSDDERMLASVAGNFSFRKDIYPGEELITIGFGIAENPRRVLMANQDSDCKVFSGYNDFHFMGDPDALNPSDYKAWSFANGCDVSHGDSGSAMVDRQTGEVVGIIWTGKIPKEKQIQDSRFLDTLFKSQSAEVWTELSYAVPASKMAVILTQALSNPQHDEDCKQTFRAILGSR